MIPFLSSTLRVLAGTALGFAAAVLLISRTANTGTAPDSLPLPPPPAESHVSAPEKGILPSSVSLPAAGTFENLSSREKLEVILGLRGISPDHRRALLQECLQRPEPERTALLRVLLSQWAETAPVAAAEWALTGLEGIRATPMIQDLLRTWAARDGESLVRWMDELSRRKSVGAAEVFKRWTMCSLQALGMHDPFQMASFGEMECLRGWTFPPMDFTRSQRTTEAVKAMAFRLRGHVTYPDDPEQLKRSLEERSGQQVMPTQDLFRQLFEDTATAWHRMDPAGCDQWLSGWPENARLAARYVIGKTEEKEKAESAQAQAPAITPDPPSALGETEEAGPESALTDIPILPEAAPPGTASVTAGQLSAWSQWWHRNSKEAEAFLDAAAWSGDLKFKARALAYASPP